MTGIDPDWTERRRGWAAKQLGLAADASAARVREHFLRRLPSNEFVPSTEERQALTLLLGRGLPEPRQSQVDHAIAQADAERLRPEVENFAADFWNLEWSDRRKRWHELLAQCTTVPALQRRLQALAPGLDQVAVSEMENDWRMLELARQIRAGFVLSPVQQVRVRQAFLATIEDGRAWKPAVRRLRSRYSLLSALAPELLEKVVKATRKLIRLPLNASLTITNSNEPVRPWVVFLGVVIGLGIFAVLMAIFMVVMTAIHPWISSFSDANPKSPTQSWKQSNQIEVNKAKQLKEVIPNKDGTPKPGGNENQMPAKD